MRNEISAPPFFFCTEKSMKKQLNPEFRECFNLSDVRVRELAKAIDMPKSSLGRVMAAAEIRATPLLLTRLHQLAGLLHYNGSIFRS
jgi:hypothetical protein